MKKIKPIIICLIILCLMPYNYTKGQILKSIESNEAFTTDFEKEILCEIFNKYTYAFCQIGRYVEFNSSNHFEIYKDLYKIIGHFSSKDTSYSHKILVERISIFNGTSYLDSIPKWNKMYLEFNPSLAYDFFVSLHAFRFHELEIDCLMNNMFPIDEELSQYVQWSDYIPEQVFIHAHNKTRKIMAYSPETFLTRYPEQLNKYPELNLCRAIYVICRNKFEDTIWNKNEP